MIYSMHNPSCLKDPTLGILPKFFAEMIVVPEMGDNPEGVILRGSSEHNGYADTGFLAFGTPEYSAFKAALVDNRISAMSWGSLPVDVDEDLLTKLGESRIIDSFLPL